MPDPITQTSVSNVPDQTPPTAPMNPSTTAPVPDQDQNQAASAALASTQPASPVTSQQQQPGMVSNQPSPAPPPVNPAVARAGLLHTIAQTLAGGPRFSVSIDPATGATIRTQAPLSGKQIGLAIALEAISGSLAGLSARGPNAVGQAAGLGLQQGQQLKQEAQAGQQQQNQQAQAQYDNQASTLARRAQVYEINSRTLLNTSEAEKYGADAIDKLVDINRASGVLDVDPGNLDNQGQTMTQAEMFDAIKSGKLSATDQMGPIAGRVEMTNPDGSKRWEATHLVIRNPNSPTTLTQDDWNRYAAAKVPGFPAGVKLGNNGTEVRLSVKQRANEIAASHTLMDYRLNDLRSVLQGTPDAANVPASLDFSKPGVDTAMTRFQKYISHSNMHGMDVLESLQQMGADKRDPKTGQMQPNPDAKYVDPVADSLGGWSVLEAAHNQILANRKSTADFAIIDSEAKANAVLASPNKFTGDQISSARGFLALSNQQGARKAAQEARARAVAEGTDVAAMYKTGVNPVSGEKLTLGNAPDSMLVDANGRPVPQNQQALYKPTAQERQTADTAKQVLMISQRLRTAVQQNPNLVGPLVGRSKQGLAAAGLGNAEVQQFLDDVSFLQTAATKMHTGRFSAPIIEKMNNVIKPGMNPDQFNGALNSINDVANLYQNEDRLITVGDLKATQNGAQQLVNRVKSGAQAGAPTSLTNIQVNPQTKQRIGWNGTTWVDATTGQAVK
jgi:hypothetical protein